MADEDQKAKEKAAEEAKAKAVQAQAEAAQANAAAVRAQDEADQANTEADQAKTDADQARVAADQAKADAGGTPDPDKEKAAEAAKKKADQANTEAEQAKKKVDQAKTEAEKAKKKADQANTEAGKAKAEAVSQPLGTPLPGLSKFLRTGMETGVKITGYLFPILIFCIVAYFLIMIAISIGPKGTLLNQLSKPEVVRGFITFLIALGTIGIAIMLVVAAFLSTDTSGDTPLKERFDMGKGVLTALIGILGTIVGFYFGSAVPPSEVQTLKVVDAKVEGEPIPAGKIKLSFQVTGGKAPYSYTVTFPAKTTIEALKGETGDGKVSAQEITIPANIKPDTDLTPIKIEVTDSDKKTAAQEIKEPKIPIKAKDGAPPKT